MSFPLSSRFECVFESDHPAALKQAVTEVLQEDLVPRWTEEVACEGDVISFKADRKQRLMEFRPFWPDSGKITLRTTQQALTVGLALSLRTCALMFLGFWALAIPFVVVLYVIQAPVLLVFLVAWLAGGASAVSVNWLVSTFLFKSFVKECVEKARGRSDPGLSAGR